MVRLTEDDDTAAEGPHREHWVVPVRGLTHADPDGTVHASAHRDGTVILHLTWGSSRTEIRLDVNRASQLCTGIQHAAVAAQRLRAQFGDDQTAPPAPQDRPVAELPLSPGQTPHHPRRQQRRSPALHHGTDASRTIGLRIRRIRHHRRKSLRVVAGLAGMSASTLHRIEHGRRDLNLTDVVALAHALQVTPASLIALPSLTSAAPVR